MSKILFATLCLSLSLSSFAGDSFPEISRALKLFMAGKMKKEKVIALIDRSNLPVKVRDLEITTVRGIKTVRWHMISPNEFPVRKR